MIKITVKYENFEGETKEEGLMFHLNKQEVAKLELKYGGIQKHLDELKTANDGEGIYSFLEELVVAAYGERKGEAFIKTPEVVEQFQYGAKLPEVMVKLLSKPDGSEISKFIMGCMTQEVRNQILQSGKLTPEMLAQLK